MVTELQTSAKAAKRARMVARLSGSGIEIGALHNPLGLPAGVEVRYVDRLTEEELRRHYPELAEAALAPISVIGDAENLSNLEDGSVDFVVANHLLEHLENPLLGLREMFRVLHDGGLLYLALPDPKVTFDRDRPVTTVGHVVDEFRGGSSSTRRGHYEEWVDLVEPLLQDYPHLLSSVSGSRDELVDHLMGVGYSIHFHVWTPERFLELLCAARDHAGLEWELLGFEACEAVDDDEFIFILRKPQHRGSSRSGSRLLNRIVEVYDEGGAARLGRWLYAGTTRRLASAVRRPAR